jgi:molybdate-binding protein
VNTVARAYAELASEGVIDAQRGGGSFVRAGAGDVIAERRGEQLRAIVADAVLRGLSLGHTPAQIEAAFQGQLSRWQAAAEGRSASRARPTPGTLSFAGSHDLALEVLAARLRERRPPVDMRLTFSGSTAGLMALLVGDAHVAGCHLSGDGSGEDSAMQIQRLLPNQRLLRITLARRQQGLIIPPGNPRGIRGVQDLASPDLVLSLRQAGAGTRLLLERELRRTGTIVDLERHPVFLTHSAVAAAVAEGAADVGLGIMAAARSFELGFIPLGWERYDLVIPQALASTSSVRALLDVVCSREYKAVVEALGGYETTMSGEQQLIG